MSSISAWLRFGRRAGTSELLQRLEQALYSLRARGAIESFELANTGARFQGDRGNFGCLLELEEKSGKVALVATPIANPVGPFARDVLGDEILPIARWVPCGPPVELPLLHKISHLELVDWLREQGANHPVTDWISQQFRQLADGKEIGDRDLQAIVLLGVRRFLKSIPSTDRLHESVESALVTLFRLKGTNESDVFGDANGAAALVSFIQETHPLEAKRAAHRYMTSR